MKNRMWFSVSLCLWVALHVDIMAQVPSETGDMESVGKVYLSLDDCLDYVETGHHAVKSARWDVVAAQAKKQEVLGMYFPKVQFTAGAFAAIQPMVEIGITDIIGNSPAARNIQYLLQQYARQMGLNTSYEAMQYGYFGGFSAMQPLFAGGRIVNGNRLASLGVEAAELQWEMKLRESKEDIESQYWMVVSLQEKRKTILRLQTLLDTVYKDVNSAYKAGLATENDRMQVELKKNELRSGMMQLDNGIRLAKMNLFNAIGFGYNPYETVRLDSLPYIDDVEMLDSLGNLQEPYSYYVPEDEVLAMQQESRLLDLQVDAQRLQKKLAVGESLPQLAVGGSYGYSKILTDGDFNGIGFVMAQIPLSDWGMGARRIKHWNAQIRKAEDDRDYLNEQLLLQIRKFWLDLTSAWEQLSVTAESVDLSQKSVDKLHSYYKAGMSPLSELLQAQSQLQDAQEKYIEKQIQYKIALELYRNRVGKPSAKENEVGMEAGNIPYQGVGKSE